MLCKGQQGPQAAKEANMGQEPKTVVQLKWREILRRHKFMTDLGFPRVSPFLLKLIINRYRSVRFSETQTGFEIPRILATSDIALRLLHTHYDHVTPLNPVPTSLQEHTSTVSPRVKEGIKNVDAAVSEEFQEESKQENESNSVHEEDINVEEQCDMEVQTVGHI